MNIDDKKIINKEEQRKKILESNSSFVRDLDYSMFGDEDPDVFAKLVLYDSYQHNIYPSLSESLKNNKEVAANAAKCSFNIPFLPDHLFQDKDVIKNIIYNRLEDQIPLKHLTKEIVNYMFMTCSRFSLSTKEIKKACDEHLSKESIVQVLLHQNDFYSSSKKRNAHPCIDDIYIPKKFIEDKDILQLLIIPQFKTIKNNTNITQEMIIELLDSGYVLSQLPSKFFKDTDFIKKCLTYEDNYHFFDDYNFIEIIEKNPQLNFECLAINPNVAKTQRYPLFFESFKAMFSQDIENIYLCSHVIEADKKKLFDYMTSQEVLCLFENKNKNSQQKYDFDSLYQRSYFYLNPIVDNQFVIEEMAKQDQALFAHISEELVNNNQFMFKLLCEYKVIVNFEDSPVEALYSKINHFGNFEKYVQMLKLENSLSSKLSNPLPTITRKI